MADSDLIFNITAIDHYKAEMDSAFALAQRQAQADQAMINVAKGVESADAARAAAGRDAAEATQQLGNATKDATDAAGKGIEGFESFKGTLVSLQAGISVAKEALGVFKQAWDFAKEGAAIQRIGEQFSNVAESINADSGRLLEGLNKAAHGTVDDEALMQTATRAMALGIASNSDDLIKLMEVARASSVAFGGDTTAAFERISGAVENLAPRALKQSGIIIDLTQAYKDYAEKLHKNADELTDQEKRQALLNQTLEKGADLVKRIGDQGEDSATKIARFETKAADVMDVVKSGVAGAFIPLLDNLNLLETITNTNVNDLEKFKVGYEALVSNGIDPTSEAMKRYKQYIDDTEAAMAKLGETSEEKALRANIALVRSFDDASYQVSNSVEDMAARTIQSYIEMGLASKNLADKTAADLKAMNFEMQTLKTGMAGAAQNEMKSYEARQTSLAEQAQKLRDQLAELEGKQGAVASTTVQHAMSAEQLNLANVRLADSMRRLNEEQDPAKQQLLAAQIAVQRDAIENANTSVVKYTDNSKQIANLKDQYDKVNEQIKKNADEHDLATKRIVFGYLEQELAAKGMTSQSVAALDALALKWGLLSKADITALNDARIAASTFAKDRDVNHLMASATGALEGLAKPAQTVEEAAKAASRATGGLSDLVTGQSTTINAALDSTKQPAQDFIDKAKGMQTEFDTNLVKASDFVNYGLNPMSSTLSVLTQQVSIFSQALGAIPGVAALLPTYVPPTYQSPDNRTYPLMGGAAAGADFITPPNPRGGSGDYFSVMSAPGERVQITPSGGMSGGANFSVTLNIGGSSASATEIQAAVYDALNDVIRSAGLSA